MPVPRKSLVIFALLQVFSLKSPKALTCYWCDSKQVICARGAITGLSVETCKPGNDYCAVQKETNSSGIVVQFIRGCVSNCQNMITKWESNTYHKSTFCRYCCDAEGCNNITGDPCDPFAGATGLRTNAAMTFIAAVLSIVTIIASI